MINRVKMKHPVTGGVIDAPERGVRLYERAGWEVVEDEDMALTNATTDGSAGPGTGEDPAPPAGSKTAKADTKVAGSKTAKTEEAK